MKPEYDRKKRKQIAILDNNEIENLLRLNNKGIHITSLLEQYEYILIPGWVYEEVCDSEFRFNFVEELNKQGFPIHVLNETDYAEVIQQEGKLLELFRMAISLYAQLNGQFKRLILKNRDPMDIDYLYSEWITIIYDNWPFEGGEILRSSGTGRMKKKNAGEISSAFLASLLKAQQKEEVDVTIWSGDADCRSCVEKITESLAKQKKDFMNEPFSVSYKNFDIIVKELYEEGIIDIGCAEDIIESIRIERRMCYVEKKEDNSSELKIMFVNNERYKEIMKDENTSIIW